MNKHFFRTVAITVICCFNVIHAQLCVRPGIALTYSNYTQKFEELPSKGVTGKTGIEGGAVCDIAALKIVSIEPGIFYSKRGSRADNDVTVDGAVITNNLSYLAIPIHVKIKYPFLISPYFLAGINIGILLEAQQTSEGGFVPSTEPPKATYNIKNDLNATDFGLDFGGGVQVDFLKVSPFIEYIYYRGLSELYIDSRYESINNIGWEIKMGVKYKVF